MSQTLRVAGPPPDRLVIGPPRWRRLMLRPATVLGLAAACLGSAAPQFSLAQTANLFASGDQARQLCIDSAEWCVGFVTGALDGWAALEAYYPDEKFCLPTDLAVGRIVEAFRGELDRRPEPREDPAAYLLYEKLIELFPCGAPREPELPG